MLLAVFWSILFYLGTSPSYGAEDDWFIRNARRWRKAPKLNKVELKHADPEITVVYVWASWCPYCKLASPEVSMRVGAFGDRKVNLIGFSVDKTIREAKKHMPEGSKRYPNFFVGEEVKKDLNIEKLPTFFVLDGKGRVKSRYAGFSGERMDYLLRRVQSLLRDEE